MRTFAEKERLLRQRVPEFPLRLEPLEELNHLVSRGVHIRAVKFNAPKVRRGRQEFHADALSTIAGFPEENDAAFLLFLSGRIFKNEHFAIVYFVF